MYCICLLTIIFLMFACDCFCSVCSLVCEIVCLQLFWFVFFALFCFVSSYFSLLLFCCLFCAVSFRFMNSCYFCRQCNCRCVRVDTEIVCIDFAVLIWLCWLGLFGWVRYTHSITRNHSLIHPLTRTHLLTHSLTHRQSLRGSWRYCIGCKVIQTTWELVALISLG